MAMVTSVSMYFKNSVWWHAKVTVNVSTAIFVLCLYGSSIVNVWNKKDKYNVGVGVVYYRVCVADTYFPKVKLI
jgi:hypothetical protein